MSPGWLSGQGRELRVRLLIMTRKPRSLMKAALAVIAAAACLATTPSSARADDVSLFNVFQKFCVATNANPSAVEAAALAAGATLITPNKHGTVVARSNIIFGPYWEIKENTDSYSFTTGTYDGVTADDGSTPVEDDCEVTSESSNRDKSLEMIRQWIGVFPAETSAPHSDSVAFYNWEQVGDAHLPSPKDKQALSEALEAGHLWGAFVMRQQKGASIDLHHEIGTFKECWTDLATGKPFPPGGPPKNRWATRIRCGTPTCDQSRTAAVAVNAAGDRLLADKEANASPAQLAADRTDIRDKE